MATSIGICGLYALGATTLGATELETIALSPLRLPVVSKPFIVAHDGAESAEASMAYHAARQRGGALGGLIALPGEGHTRLLDSLRAPDGALCRAVLDLVAQG
ncbi:MAG: alpha/beta hydrolase [Roseomonas sp.]|nr:alpha/beta hydrolase [Roseomonas sp.]